MKKYILDILIVISLCAVILSIISIFTWNRENYITEKEINEIEDKVKVEEIEDTEETIILSENDENLINTDLTSLKEINNEVKGWLQVKGTTINHPFVQHNDNDYYLTHSFEKNNSKAGWIFMDYRNNPEFEDKNTIIYGHNRLNQSMFGTLKNVLNKKWYNDRSNHIIKVTTEKVSMNFQIFSIYKIKTTSDYIKTSFKDDTEYNKFINMIKSRSTYKFDIDVTSEDKILTLSTCSGSQNKLVVHAKLIKVQYKEEA